MAEPRDKKPWFLLGGTQNRRLARGAEEGPRRLMVLKNIIRIEQVIKSNLCPLCNSGTALSVNLSDDN